MKCAILSPNFRYDLEHRKEKGQLTFGGWNSGDEKNQTVASLDMSQRPSCAMTFGL